MKQVIEQIGKLKSNPIGTLAGAGAGLFVATKLVKTEKMWMTIAISVVGGVVGAMVQANMKAKKGVPTATTVATANTK
jgi:outer membrane lipoprotein SlyB